jgi:hypothetical protein
MIWIGMALIWLSGFGIGAEVVTRCWRRTFYDPLLTRYNDALDELGGTKVIPHG